MEAYGSYHRLGYAGGRSPQRKGLHCHREAEESQADVTTDVCHEKHDLIQNSACSGIMTMTTASLG